jgi:cysteine desulfuration protein SufE
MTINEAQKQIIAQFAQFSDWLEKYEYLIGLGSRHAAMEQRLKTERNLLPGCQSQVWIRAELIDGRLHFEADSDSLIIRGILALLLQALNDQLPEDIATADLYFLREIGLSSNLSPSRANGVAAIIRRLQHWPTPLPE